MEDSMKVLVIEDDVSQADLIKNSLKRFNPEFEVDTLQSGNGCLGKLGGQGYEAVILDFHLSGENGLEVLSNIYRDSGDTPVIVVSDYGSEHDAVEALKQRAHEYVVKDSTYLSVLPKLVQKTIEQYRLKVRLRETERMYQNIFENANDAIFILQPQTFRILEANNKSTAITGYRKEALPGKNFVELFPAHSQPLVREVLHEAGEKSTVSDDTLSLFSSAGKLVPVEIHASMMQWSNRDYILCNVNNIAEKKHLQGLILKSKKRLQTTFDGIKEIIFQVDHDYNVVIANKKFAELQASEPGEIIGKKYYEIFCNQTSVCEDCPVSETFKTLEPAFSEKENNGAIYEMWSYPIFDMEGKLESVAVYGHDVTEKKKLEKTLIQSEKLATIGLLASGIAHELRNPLNVIETARYYIDEFLAAEDSDISAKLDIIRKSVRRSSKIINNLLEFSRHSEHDRERIDIKFLIENTVSLIKKEFDAKNIEFAFVCSENYTTFFNIDTLKQVLLNLIINAIQAMNRGGKLTVQVGPGQQGWVNIRISDTGVGIPKENLPHIFSPFFTTKEVGEGTGLGLYITHMIIQREGGSIKVDSVVDVGTTFTIALPESADSVSQ